MIQPIASNISWERVVQTLELIRTRLLRATGALDDGKVPYAVIGGFAVQSWVSTVDRAAVRFTQDVDILLRRSDLPAATAAMEKAGFVYHQSYGIDMFLDGPDAGPRDAVHVVFAQELTPGLAEPTPDIADSERGSEFQVITLMGLVRMKLATFRDKDRVHLRDMIGLGLIDASWLSRFPPDLAARLQEILDTPNG